MKYMKYTDIKPRDIKWNLSLVIRGFGWTVEPFEDQNKSFIKSANFQTSFKIRP